MKRAALIVLVTACGGDELQLEDHSQSGSRLKVQRWDAAGAESLASDLLYDSVLDVLCRPLGWSDGGSYCVPTDERGSADIMYTDAGCTQPLAAVLETACTPPAFAIEFDDVGATRVVEVGAPSAATQYYDLTNGTCIGPLEIANHRTHVFHATGREIDPATLATIAPGPVRGSGRIRRVYLESPDGARLPFAYYDATLDAGCHMRTIGETSTCWPDVATIGVTYYADPACTRGLVASFEAQARFVSYDGEVYEPHAAVTVPPLYSVGLQGDCRPTEPMPGATYRPLGKPVVLDVLVRAPEATARISPLLLKSNDSILRDRGFFDRDFDDECRPGRFADDVTRCVPRAGNLRSFHTEPSCTAPPVKLYEHILRPGVAPPPFVIEGEARGCTGVITALSTLGAVREGGVFDRTITGACVPHQAPGGEIVPADYYFAGDAVDPSRLVEVTLVR